MKAKAKTNKAKIKAETNGKEYKYVQAKVPVDTYYKLREKAVQSKMDFGPWVLRVLELVAAGKVSYKEE